MNARAWVMAAATTVLAAPAAGQDRAELQGRDRRHRRLWGGRPRLPTGVDITVPVYQFAETHYLDDLVVTPACKLTLFALTGKVNSAGFKGFAAGECLFLGAAGTKRGSGDWQISFRFVHIDGSAGE